MGGQRLNRPVVAMATTADGHGYWLVASDGGSLHVRRCVLLRVHRRVQLNRPVSGVASTPDGKGYWLVASDGGIFTFGDAGYFGSVPGQGISAQPPVVAMTRTPSGFGYWLVGSNGAVTLTATLPIPGLRTGSLIGRANSGGCFVVTDASARPQASVGCSAPFPPEKPVHCRVSHRIPGEHPPEPLGASDLVGRDDC